MEVYEAGTLPATIALRSTIVATVIEDGAVLLDLDSKFFYTLNKSAWALVQLCETGAASTDAIARQAIRWGASGEEGVRAFLQRLVDAQIVEDAETPEHPPEVTFEGEWTQPEVVRHADPLQTIVTSAFDPSIPLAE